MSEIIDYPALHVNSNNRNLSSFNTFSSNSDLTNQNIVNIEYFPNIGCPSVKHKIKKEVIKHIKFKTNNTFILLDELINCSNSKGECNASQSTLAKRTITSISTVRRGLRELEEHGFIKTKKRGWKQTLTVTLLFLRSDFKLNNKAVTVTDDLKSLNTLRDLNNNLPLKEDRHKSNLQEAIEEYEQFAQEVLQSKIEKQEIKENEAIEVAKEATETLPIGLRAIVLMQIRDYVQKNQITHPRAFVRAVIEREARNFANSEECDKKRYDEQQRQFREEAARRIERTRLFSN